MIGLAIAALMGLALIGIGAGALIAFVDFAVVSAAGARGRARAPHAIGGIAMLLAALAIAILDRVGRAVARRLRPTRGQRLLARAPGQERGCARRA